MEDLNNPKDDFLEDYEYSNTFTPQGQDINTFKQRNDPEPLLHKLRLELMNCYEETETITDDAGAEIRTKKKLKRIPNTTARANKEGIEDIISYMRTLINAHTVQGNLSEEGYRIRMRHIANNITQHFIAHRITWDIDFNYTDVLIVKAKNLADLFLTRLKDNEERKSYGESFKETTSRSVKPEDKPTFLQRAAGLIIGNRNRGF